jgi:hypothetical protein
MHVLLKVITPDPRLTHTGMTTRLIFILIGYFFSSFNSSDLLMIVSHLLHFCPSSRGP